MWKWNDKFTRHHRFAAMATLWAIVIVTAFFVIFGMGIVYAIIIGIVSGLITSFLAFQRYDDNA